MSRCATRRICGDGASRIVFSKPQRTLSSLHCTPAARRHPVSQASRGSTDAKESVMSKFIEYAVGALAALFIVAWQGAALGGSLDGPDVQPVSVSVRYADLDLSRPADVTGCCIGGSGRAANGPAASANSPVRTCRCPPGSAASPTQSTTPWSSWIGPHCPPTIASTPPMWLARGRRSRPVKPRSGVPRPGRPGPGRDRPRPPPRCAGCRLAACGCSWPWPST